MYITELNNPPLLYNAPTTSTPWVHIAPTTSTTRAYYMYIFVQYVGLKYTNDELGLPEVIKNCIGPAISTSIEIGPSISSI